MLRVDRDIALLVGRVLLVSLFLSGGFVKLKYLSGTAAYMQEVGIPGAGEPLALCAGLIEFLGALAILIGWRTRTALLILIVYLFPVTWYTHLDVARAAADSVVRDNELLQTFKNVSVMGGLFLLYVTGPGVHSLDKRK